MVLLLQGAGLPYQANSPAAKNTSRRRCWSRPRIALSAAGKVGSEAVGEAGA
jgi:hypothetical protein